MGIGRADGQRRCVGEASSPSRWMKGSEGAWNREEMRKDKRCVDEEERLLLDQLEGNINS
jgi:hypothetical protein